MDMKNFLDLMKGSPTIWHKVGRGARETIAVGLGAGTCKRRQIKTK